MEGWKGGRVEGYIRCFGWLLNLSEPGFSGLPDFQDKRRGFWCVDMFLLCLKNGLSESGFSNQEINGMNAI